MINYKEVVEEAKKQFEDDKNKVEKDTVLSKVKDLLKKIEDEDKQVKLSTERVANFKKQLIDIELGNVKYQQEISNLITCKDNKGNEFRITPQGVDNSVLLGSKTCDGITVDVSDSKW
ncbi:MAG: hypothetical protein WC307_05165 [Candidatus Nanoarchaeia archaeon]